MSRIIQASAPPPLCPSAAKLSIPASPFPRSVEDCDFAAEGRRGKEAEEEALFSIQPVLHLQAGNFFEIDEVPCQHRGIVFQSDAGDAKIFGADTKYLSLETAENLHQISTSRQNEPVTKAFEAVIKVAVGFDAAVCLSMRLNGRQPASHDFLRCDDCQNALIFRSPEPQP